MRKAPVQCTLLIVFGTMSLGVGCAEDDASTNYETPCTTGDVRSCTCTNVDEEDYEGTQFCSEFDGSWEECRCAFAFLRFCHSLKVKYDEWDHWLEIAGDNETVILTAYTGECDTSADGRCAIVPAGTVNLTYGYDDIVIEGDDPPIEHSLEAGKSYLFTASMSGCGGVLRRFHSVREFPFIVDSTPWLYGGRYLAESCEDVHLIGSSESCPTSGD